VADQAEIHRKMRSEDVRERIEAVFDCSYNIAFITDKQQVGEDIHWLAHDDESSVRLLVAGAILGIIPHVPNKNQAWEDLIRLASDTDNKVRWGAAYVLGSAFSHVPDKKQVWEDLHLLTSDSDSDVRASAYHSLGKASIFKAANAENDVDLKKEMEVAIGYFEQSSKQENDYKPAKFCLPFYRSFYSLTFQKEDAEAEVKKYIAEAKSAIEGSESKEKLLEAVENLGNALKEAQKPRDFNDMKSDLNAYRRYCDRACELLDTTEDKAPGASRLIRRGLPIIDERIKGIIAEIEEKTKVLCKQSKGTIFEENAIEAKKIGSILLQIRDPIGLEKNISYLQFSLSAICEKFSANDKREACELIKTLNNEPKIEDKIPLINMILSKISSQIETMDRQKIEINNPVINQSNVQIGNKNQQVISTPLNQNEDSRIKREKPDIFKLIIDPSTLAALGGFFAVEIGTYFYPVSYNHLIGVFIAVVILIIGIFIKHRKTKNIY